MADQEITGLGKLETMGFDSNLEDVDSESLKNFLKEEVYV